MSSPILAEPIPHSFLSSSCALQPPDGSQVSPQEGQGISSAALGQLPPWLRAQRTSLDGDTAVLTARLGPDSRITN